MLRTKCLINGLNTIDGQLGEYIGTFWDGYSFIAIFDSKRMEVIDSMSLHVVRTGTVQDYPNEYTVEAFGPQQVVLMDLEN